MIKIKFKKLHENATIPKQGSELAGGWDVTATEIIQESEDFVICKLGFALEFPEKYKLTLVPRSSLTKTKWILQNSPGLGDADYKGEFQYRFRALSDGVVKKNTSGGLIMDYFELTYPKFPFEVGDRIGQIYLEDVIPIEFELVEELSETKRGDNGFGSTGK
jgi:dUTP pyrophosphatase